jgi:hypothetical protein
MKNSLYAVVLLLSLMSSAFAITIEPLVGHNFAGKSEVHGGGGKYSGINGLGYGGRIAYQKLGVTVAADYLHSDLDMHDSDFGRKLNTNEFAGLVGFRFPFLLKIYGGYVFSANGSGDYKTSGLPSQSLKLNSGHGYKLGAGWTFFPLLDFNIEYRSLQFDDYKLGGVKNKSNADLSIWMVSVSMPIRLFE